MSHHGLSNVVNQDEMNGIGYGFTNFDYDYPIATTVADEEELVEHVKNEIHPHLMKAKHRETLAHEAVDLAQKHGWDFTLLFMYILNKYRVRPPSITVEFQNLTVTTDAIVGSAGIPTVGNSIMNILKLLVGQKPPTKKHTILHNMSGVFLPGRITLVLGPPSCGKSTFLKVLAGRYKSTRKLKIDGDVKYCGHTQKEFYLERTAAFVDQYDNHVPILTVGETLEFAYICQVGLSPKQLRLFDHLYTARERIKRAQALAGAHQDDDDDSHHEQEIVPVPKDFADMPPVTEELEEQFFQVLRKIIGTGIRVELVERMLGLTHASHTQVGDASVRGVSGGERKRVTTAEMVVGPRQLLLMDEISTGLDSATLYSEISFFAKLTHGLHTTTVVTLLQPPPEVFNLFDDLLLMAEGTVVYHGPVQDAQAFFTSIGFICPDRKDVPSFLQEVTTPSGQMEYASDDLKQKRAAIVAENVKGGRMKPLMTVDEMAKAYWDMNEHGKMMRQRLDNPYDRSRVHPDALVKSRYALNPLLAAVFVTKRSFTLVLRDRTLMVGQIMQCIVIGLIISSLFYSIDVSITTARNFLGASFMNSMFMAMIAMPQLSTTMATKATWYKFRSNYFYHGFTHALATTIAYMPVSIIAAFLYGIITYWMMGYNPAPGYFFTYICVLISMTLASGSLFRFIAFVAPNQVLANSFGGITLLILIVMSGFTIVRTSIPNYWIWAYYLSPFSWALRGIVLNEFSAPRWDIPISGSSLPLGEYVLDSYGFFNDRVWIWGGVAYLNGFVLLATFCSGLALQYLPGPTPSARVADEEELEKARNEALERKKGSAIMVQVTPSSPESDEPSTARKDVAPGFPRASGSFKKMHPTQLSLVRQNSLAKDEITGNQVLNSNCPAIGLSPQMTSIPFMPVTLVWEDLRYFVPNPAYSSKDKKKKKTDVEQQADQVPERLELLKGITGYCEPGVLTALMGGSGAGKTTLMDCIAGRKTIGEITGNIFVNGHPKVQATWARFMGYVEQMDIHSPSATVIEALRFSARLRLAREITDQQVAGYVDEVMEIVELTDIMFDLVGTPGVSGLSVEQRKRLTIAVELVANPAVVFMDEPTSGLDARAAAIVMRAVRNVARNNRAVIVTIHQPSIEIFESFDYLLLLQRGGRTTYFGPLGYQSSSLIAYLEAVPGCEPIKAGVNPATWMLEVTGGSMAVAAKAVSADFPALYTASQLATNNAQRCTELVERDRVSKPELKVTTVFAASFKVQCRELLYKYLICYWRTPSYNLTRMIQTVIVALIYGSLFFKQGYLPNPATLADVQDVMGLIYGSTSFLGMTNLMSVMPVLGTERVVMYRERAAQMYAPQPFNFAIGLVEIPYSIAQILLFVCIMYWLMDYVHNVNKFFFYWFMSWLSTYLFTSFGVLLVYITPNQQLAQVLGSTTSFIWNSFNGFVITYPLIPKYWQWLNRICPTTWILYGLASDQLSDNYGVLIQPGTNTTVSAYLKDTFGYDTSLTLWCLLIVFAFIFAFRGLSSYALGRVSFQRR